MRKCFYALLFILMIQFAGRAFRPATELERQRKIMPSSHYINGKFVNPNGVSSKVISQESWDVLKEYFTKKRIDLEPDKILPVHQLQSEQWKNRQDGEFSFSWLGHSSILISVDKKLILVDPVLEDRASPFSWIGPKRFHPSPVTAEDLPPIDFVLITHDHYDHLEKSTIVKIASKVERFIVPVGTGELLAEWGVSYSKITALDWWGEYSAASLKFCATPAIHYSSRGLFDTNERLWSSWAITGNDASIFISGDSGYFDGFREIGERLGPFDVTFVLIGAYNDKGTWRKIHMTPEEAGELHMDIGGTYLVPLHWATFNLAFHPWYEPIERLVAFADKKSIKLITPEIGERIYPLRGVKTDHWWTGYK